MGGFLTVAILLCYANSFQAPFLFDDQSAILRNPSIRHFWSLDIFRPPHDAAGATGRPLVNFTLALNYAVSGDTAWGYHLFNTLLHLGSAWLVFGLLRRTLLSPHIAWPDKSVVVPFAASAALLWAVHPLQTESVTCVIQRTELLGGFFLLLTLYGFARAANGEKRWGPVAVASCALGMTAKEFMAVAPVLALLYDRTFIAGSFRAAWQQHARLHASLFASWFVLAIVLLQAPQRNHNVGFGLGVGAWDYFLTQCHAIVLYLKLSLWPHPLVLDYGAPLVHRLAEVWWQAILLLALGLATLWAHWRRPALGFLGAWFFVILAPSSSFVPLTTQTMAEHRMYLPLLAVIVGGTLALWRLPKPRAATGAIALSLLFAGLTWARNEDYATPLSIWSDTVAKAPNNHRARYNLGNTLNHLGRVADALPHYEAALALKPNDATIRYNYANALGQLSRWDDAIANYQRALQNDPSSIDLHANLGSALAQAERLPEALEQYQQASRLSPQAADLHASIGTLLIALGRTNEGLQAFDEALALKPDYLEARVQLADLLLQLGRAREAIAHYEIALHQKPGSSELLGRLQAARATSER